MKFWILSMPSLSSLPSGACKVGILSALGGHSCASQLFEAHHPWPFSSWLSTFWIFIFQFILSLSLSHCATINFLTQKFQNPVQNPIQYIWNKTLDLKVFMGTFWTDISMPVFCGNVWLDSWVRHLISLANLCPTTLWFVSRDHYLDRLRIIQITKSWFCSY